MSRLLSVHTQSSSFYLLLLYNTVKKTPVVVGFVFRKAFVNGEKVAEYGPRGSFGELALMYNCERAATVRAVTASRLWTMDLSTFRRSLATAASSQIVSRCEFLRKVPLLAELNNEQACVNEEL